MSSAFARPSGGTEGFPAAGSGYGRAGSYLVVVILIALATGLALRLVQLDVRPMHHDEANQAIKFGALLEHGQYVYDAHEHHGIIKALHARDAAACRGVIGRHIARSLGGALDDLAKSEQDRDNEAVGASPAASMTDQGEIR